MTASCNIASNSLFTSQLPPLSCHCADQSQQSQVLCFIKKGDCAVVLYGMRLTSCHLIYFMLPKVLISKKNRQPLFYRFRNDVTLLLLVFRKPLEPNSISHWKRIPMFLAPMLMTALSFPINRERVFDVISEFNLLVSSSISTEYMTKINFRLHRLTIWRMTCSKCVATSHKTRSVSTLKPTGYCCCTVPVVRNT
jgi:hypothetical protein